MTSVRLLVSPSFPRQVGKAPDSTRLCLPDTDTGWGLLRWPDHGAGGGGASYLEGIQGHVGILVVNFLFDRTHCVFCSERKGRW